MSAADDGDARPCCWTAQVNVIESEVARDVWRHFHMRVDASGAAIVKRHSQRSVVLAIGELDARVDLTAEPRFVFDVTGFAKVEVSAFGFTKDLYDKKWNLAAFEYGSGLRIGVHAPVHYEQGKPFAFLLDDVRFELPKVDPGRILQDLVKRIA